MSFSDFIHLRLHSAYSLAEGAIFVKKLPTLCVQNGMPAVAITDTNNLFGALEIAMACADKGVQPIVGIQLDIAVENVPEVYPLVLLATSETGYRNLLKLVSRSYLREDKADIFHVKLSELPPFAEGLICLTGGSDGLLGQLICNHPECDLETLHFLRRIFPNHLYLEITRHGLSHEHKTEPQFLSWAQEYNIPLVATNNVFFDQPDMFEAHDALLCIAGGSYVDQEVRRRATKQHYFKTAQEMKDLFSDLPEATQNTVHIARRCHFMPTAQKPILPRFDCGEKTEDETLRLQAHQGLEKRLEREVYPRFEQSQHAQLKLDYAARLEYELGIIQKMGFPGYFLIVSDFIQWAKNHNIPVGPGRGSGAGSLVAWATSITDMDPIRFGLIFERFLNPERVSMPDFDVDFCQDRRDEVISYVCEKYGKERVAHIITFGKLQARAVLRDVGRVLQMPYGQVDRISKLVPSNPANPVTLDQALDMEPELRKMYKSEEDVKRLIDLGMKLEGLYRHASTHAAGVVIGERPLEELVPLYYDERSILPATQFNMKYVETAGLVKFDFLGLKTLTVIEHAAALIRAREPGFMIQTIALDDSKTFELLGRVEVVGVFQLESAGMRDVLRKLQPDRFEDLIALVALYRPGPMDDIPRYLACKHGEEEVTYLHPKLEPILAPTYGVMVYQEQVMKIAQELGGYTLGAADLLRRAMGKKIKSEMDEQRAIFTRGAIENGVDKKTASLIFDQMAKFAGYGFNKSHAAPYALLAYQTAYLKANYPREFFASTMTLDMHNTDKLNTYRSDMELYDMTLLPPDINASTPYFTVENKDIRYGLAGLKNVGAAAMQLLVDEREKAGPFVSLPDFAKRVDSRVTNKRQMESLIAAGAFDAFQKNRRQIFESIDMLSRYGQTYQSEKKQKQTLLFGGAKEDQTTLPFQLTDVTDWPNLERLQKEFDALGFYLSSHPLDVYAPTLKKLSIAPSYTLPERATSSIQTIYLAGIMLSKQERTSKTGNKFAFATFSDNYGLFEVTFFSDILAKSRDLLVPGTPLYITANIRLDGESVRLSAQLLQRLDDKMEGHSVQLEVDDGVCVDTLVACLKGMKKGAAQVRFIIKTKDLPDIAMQLPQRYKIGGSERSLLDSIPGVRILGTNS